MTDSGIRLARTCDACPVQYEGEVDGCPAYFRYRFGFLEFTIVKVGCEPVWPRQEDVLYYFGIADDHQPWAGDMDHETAFSIITEHVGLWRQRKRGMVIS